MDPEQSDRSSPYRNKIAATLNTVKILRSIHKYLNLPAVRGGGAVHPHRGVQDREQGRQLLMQEPNNKGKHCGHLKKKLHPGKMALSLSGDYTYISRLILLCVLQYVRTLLGRSASMFAVSPTLLLTSSP